MRRLLSSLVIGIMVTTAVIGFSTSIGYTSDWDKAGKILTAFEGIRVLTGGNVDIIGGITGIKQNKKYTRSHAKHDRCEITKDKRCLHYVWVPTMAWKKEYIPEHKEYSEKYGTIIVEAHYIRYQVEQGGYWVTKYNHDCNYNQHDHHKGRCDK